MRGVQGVEFPAASLFAEVCTALSIPSSLLAPTKLVPQSDLSFLAGPLECEEMSEGIYATGCVHRFDVNSSGAHTIEHDGPTLATDRPGPICVEAHICERRADFKTF